MLEGYFASVLNKYVGEYLEDLNTDQLSIALLSGQVELENVPLKKSALSKFDIPISVKSGVVGRLSVTIPITAIRSEPWIVKLNDVLILLGPSEEVFNGKEHEEAEQQRKEKLYTELEDNHKKNLLRKANILSVDHEEQSQWWGASMISSIINNIQLIITNVHIRYEDNVTMSQGTTFKFGLRIQTINVHTANKDWKTGFISNENDCFSHKKLIVKGASLYWNVNEKELSNVVTIDDLKKILIPQNYKETCNIIKPFGLQIRMTKNLSKLHLVKETDPRFKFNMRPKKLDIEITTQQLLQIKALTKEWTRFDRAKKYRKWRPKEQVCENANIWWKFSIDRILDSIKKRNSRNNWDFAISKAKIINKYSRGYRKKLIFYIKEKIKKLHSFDHLNSFFGNEDLEDCKREVFYMKQIERDNQISYADLSIIRDYVYRKLMSEIENITRQNSYSRYTEEIEGDSELLADGGRKNSSNIYSWFSSWFPRSESNTSAFNDDEDNSFTEGDVNLTYFKYRELPTNLKKIEQKMEEDLFDALNETWDDSAIFTRDKILANLNLKMEKIIIRLISDNGNMCNCIAIDLSKVSSNVQLSVREHRTEIMLSVGDFNIQCTKVTPVLNFEDINLSTPNDNGSSHTIIADEYEGDNSLYGGFGDAFSNDSVQIIFTVGKSKHKDEYVKKNNPMISIAYSRFAPKTTVFHDFNAEFEPLSVIYDESSMENFLTIFNIYKVIDNGTDSVENKQEEVIATQENNFYCHIQLPMIDVMLKTRRSDLFSSMPYLKSSEVFATAIFEGVSIGIAKTEEYLTKYKFGIQSMCVRDFYDYKLSKLIDIKKKHHKAFKKIRSHSESYRKITCSKTLKYGSAVDISKDYSNVFDDDEYIKEYETDVINQFFDHIKCDFELSENDQLLITIVQVEPKHHQFYNVYKEVKYNVNMQALHIDIGMNRRAWILIQDFIGLIPRSDVNRPSKFNEDVEFQELLLRGLLELDPTFSENIEKEKHYKNIYIPIDKSALLPGKLVIKSNIESVKLYMNLPKCESCLGIISLDKLRFDLKMDLNNETIPMEMYITTDSLKINNMTPIYNTLYQEVLSLQRNKGKDGSPIEISILKHRTLDPELKRPFDIKLDILVDNSYDLSYLHTHRYLCAITDFWLNYVELLDKIIKLRMNGDNDDDYGSLLTRTLINCTINCSGYVALPLNQFSNKCIIMKMDGIKVTNKFELSSQSNYMDTYVIDKNVMHDNYDCLFDNMEIFVSNLKIFEGLRIEKHSKEFSSCTSYLGGFKNIVFMTDFNSILSEQYTMKIIFGRNLSSLISHNGPNMTAVMLFNDVDIAFTTEFYKLLRGFLENNLGDLIQLDTSTIPDECLNLPSFGISSDQLKQYINISFRMHLSNVNLNLLTPVKYSKSYENLATIVCDDAMLGFDGYIEDTSEINFIAYSMRLIDRRRESTDELFTEILIPKMDTECTEKRVIAEMHIFTKKDEAPNITFVLQKVKLLIIPDLFMTLNEFFMLYSDFVPPTEEIMKDNQAMMNFLNNKKSLSVDTIVIYERKHTITLKVQFTDSDLVFIENYLDPQSLALTCSTTAVLQLDDKNGYLSTEFIIKKVEISWCIFGDEGDSNCIISTPFQIEIKLDINSSYIPSTMKTASTVIVCNPEEILPKHYITVKLDNCSFRLSYKDLLVICNVLEGSRKLLDKFQSQVFWAPLPSIEPNAFNTIDIDEINCSISDFSLWILDDFKGSALPMARLSSVKWGICVKDKNITSGGTISIEYFNQKFSGWEPFLEPTEISHFDIEYSKNKSIYATFKVNPKSSMDFNITTHLIQQLKLFSNEIPYIKETTDKDFRKLCRKGRTNNMLYIITNHLGSDISFTSEISKLFHKDDNYRKAVKWIQVPSDESVTFSLPVTVNHLYTSEHNDYSRIVLSIEDYEYLQPINIDSVRTYNIDAKKKINKSVSKKLKFVKLLIKIGMDSEGRRSITVRTAYSLSNYLTIPIVLKIDNSINGDTKCNEAIVDVEKDYIIPLKYVYSKLFFYPIINNQVDLRKNVSEYSEIIFDDLENNENVLPPFAKFVSDGNQYFVSFSRHSDEKIFYNKVSPGFNVSLYPPLIIRNQLPTDVYCNINNQNRSCQTGNMILLGNIDVDNDVSLKFETDRLKSIEALIISREYIMKLQNKVSKSMVIKMIDEEKRRINVYADISLSKSGSIVIVLWVTYWIVNKSGIPLIIKKSESSGNVAGQLPEHEQGNDKIPLMLSFNGDEEVQKCQLRIGKSSLMDGKYIPEYSIPFKLTPGEQSIALYMRYGDGPRQIRNIGLEVRQGTGRYKDTQVVILSPRYLLINRSSYIIYVVHVDDKLSENKITLEPNSKSIWNELFEGNKMISIKLNDVKYWSQGFRIDQVGSYHITVRASDQTPNFVRVETTLNNARFCVTFSDTEFYPPPIQIINDSCVPILYQQFSHDPIPYQLKSLCKAYSKVDYAWDNLYGQKLLTLQVSTESSYSYDPSKPTTGPPLYYDNYNYIFFGESITGLIKGESYNSQMDGLVLTVIDSKQVKLMPVQKKGFNLNQLWNFTSDGVIECVGMKNFKPNSKNNHVLDLFNIGREFMLVVNLRDKNRNQTQVWKFDEEGKMSCGLLNGYLKANKGISLKMSFLDNSCTSEYIFRKFYQKEGTGILNVQCCHVGPTLVIKISNPDTIDRKEKRMRDKNERKYEINFTISNGIGFSIINSMHEELIYGKLKGVHLNLTKMNDSYMSTFNVHSIQIDNQLKDARIFYFFYCEAFEEKERLAKISNGFNQPEDPEMMFCLANPAMKAEFNYTPKEHYDSFECLKLLFSSISINLDEQLLWKFIEFVQESGTAESILQRNLIQPPNIDLDNVDDISTRRCYFGNLILNVGNISLSVETIPINGMPKKLRKIKQNFNIRLMSFENASITLPPFVQTHTFETISFLAESLSKFYMNELYTQTFNIIVSLDAFGNPLGLATDIKDSFQALIFEGSVSGFVSGFSYGVANSFSKVMSSMATGVGTLITDSDYELKRRKALIGGSNSFKEKNPLNHLYSGFKGLGTGVIGGATAIVGNTMKETKNKGLFAGLVKGVGTGVVDTVTKPVQGVFDFIGGTASAMKEVAGSGHNKKYYAPKNRLRLPRVCTNLFNLLQPYKVEFSIAQQMISNKFNNSTLSSILMDIDIYHEQKIGNDFVQLCALICSDKTYFIRRINENYCDVIDVLNFKNLPSNSPLIAKKLDNRNSSKNINYTIIDAYQYDVKTEKKSILQIKTCSHEKAQILCDKLNRAKELYDHATKII